MGPVRPTPQLVPSRLPASQPPPTTGDKLPVTSALNNLRGQFFTDYNLLAAGSVIVALPTLIVFFALQKQFIAGLTLGANKG